MYAFPAIFDYAADGISISFPDLPGCLPCAHSTEEAIKNAHEALLLHLCSMKADNEKIPQPSDAPAIILEPGQSIFMIEADLSVCQNPDLIELENALIAKFGEEEYFKARERAKCEKPRKIIPDF